MMTPDQQLKQIAAQLVASMLDNHSGDWNDQETARAVATIYQAVKSAAQRRRWCLPAARVACVT